MQPTNVGFCDSCLFSFSVGFLPSRLQAIAPSRGYLHRHPLHRLASFSKAGICCNEYSVLSFTTRVLPIVHVIC